MSADWGSSADITPDWPVAPIPGEQTATHPAGEQLPLRWPHHGDLRILVDVDTLEAFAAAEDLIALAELDIDVDDLHPTIRPTTTWARRHGDTLIAHYTLADAVTVLQHNPTHQTGELLAWMREQIPAVLSDEVIDHAVGLESFCTAYTVQQAAMILDRDPAIAIGRTRLFGHLEQIGWARRDDAGYWTPTSTARQHHRLTIRTVTIQAGTKAATPYPQLYITPDGLDDLRRTLHALHTDTPATPPTPAPLFT